MHKADIAGNREAYILEHFQSLLNSLFILLFDYLKKRLNKKTYIFIFQYFLYILCHFGELLLHSIYW